MSWTPTNPKQAVCALEPSRGRYDPESPEILKDLDRAKNMSGFCRIAAYKAADAGALTWNILVTCCGTFLPSPGTCSTLPLRHRGSG